MTTTTGGINITAVVAGIITVRFGCDPGEVVESAPPSTIVYTDPAATFASTQAFVPPDAAGAATVNGPVKAGATTKSYKVKVTNQGIQPITVDPTTGQITGSVTVNGAPNGAVVSTSTKAKTINPGHSTTFGLDWTGGPVASGDSVVFTGCVNLAGDFNTANDCSNSTVSVK